ncbi:hypothetical protein NIES2119_09865 [[Phormidium ambiguum] IAM M-71]|uniref:Uncharacterized protein n=1 Tax=[Phormidium ambiguum] IAM M-71 TaxID=454136 RepID=A0A1U7IM15_9CYAN|nr:hypothetical protein [Phormidium ambiguum]OKH38333.1 hypothetical protein NIES2119_09865 [Phormidium ambiguum IAM M-71]
MTKNNDQSIHAEINKYCEQWIEGLIIDFDKEDKGWYWRYYAIDVRLRNKYFQSPIEALIHFTAYIASEIEIDG